MASLIPSYSSVVRRMHSGEKRFAQRLEGLLDEDYLCWYDVAIGPKHQHPDFVVLHPRRGLLILEVKDWKVDSIQKIDRSSTILMTDRGLVTCPNPLEQARQYAFVVKNSLERDPQLRAPEGHSHAGKLVCPYGYGVVLAGITRRQFDGTDLSAVLPSHLVICQDEMTESADAEQFQERLWGMFTVQFGYVLTLPQIDRIRWHMFPELRISQRSLLTVSDDISEEELAGGRLLRVMDLRQEQIARNLGEGHRVIHGVAGSGKTLILGYRCEQLAKTTAAPILVLCFNIALATKLEHAMAARGLTERVTVRHFHRWCMEQLTLYQVAKPAGGMENDEFFREVVLRVTDGVIKGQIPRAQYGAVLIDEGHDFEADWLTLVTQMIDPESNSLLLLYDDAQSIYGKKRPAGFSFKRVGIQAQGRTTILRVNYRNTDDIQRCAYRFAQDLLTPAAADDDGIPLVEPEMAGRRGPAPQLVRMGSLKAEAAHIAMQLARRHGQGTPWNQMAVLYCAPFVARDVNEALGALGIPFNWMKDRRSKASDPRRHAVAVLTLHSSKGLEFPIVAIAGVGFLPYGEVTEEARLLYVGMTRATEELLLTTSRDSSFVERLLSAQEAA